LTHRRDKEFREGRQDVEKIVEVKIITVWYAGESTVPVLLADDHRVGSCACRYKRSAVAN
jgi:glutaredoxin